jgi:methylmalonyl-CoA mutase N-terminal domain/subunit
VESQDAIVVGVNKFQVDEEEPVSTLRIDPALESAQIGRVRALRARRDSERCEASLATLEQAARSDENLLPHILNSVESYATVGEISNRLRKVWGEYKEISTL